MKDTIKDLIQHLCGQETFDRDLFFEHLEDHVVDYDYLKRLADLLEQLSKAAVVADKYIQVEYDLNYWGGDYAKVGFSWLKREFAYIPLTLIEHLQGNLDSNQQTKGEDEAVKSAFEQFTGHDPKHIVNYAIDDTYDKDGNRLEV